MRSLIYSQVKPVVARALGRCEDDPRVLEVANEAQERLLNRDNDPVGSWQRYRVCVGGTNCLVWPRQFRTILGWWLCDQPGQLFNEWYELVGWDTGGYGLANGESYRGTSMIDRGTVCSFDNVIATTAAPRKMQLVATSSTDEGKLVTLCYVDSNGNKKITSIDGSYQEGEQLVLSTSGVLTSSEVATGGLYRVVKTETNFPVRLYSYDEDAGVQTALLGVYEPSETVPIYRSYYLPGLTRAGSCSGTSDGDCSENKTVTVLARMQHVPFRFDQDPLVLGNLAAIKLFTMGVNMEEKRELQLAEYYFAKARAELDGEMASYLGDGETLSVRTPPVDTWGGGGIYNPGMYGGWYV